MSIARESLQELSREQKRELLRKLGKARGMELRRYPLSFSQQRLWFLDRLSPGTPFYVVEAVQPIPGAIDVESLRKAINSVVQRHEVLRTTFREVDGEPVQLVSPALEVPLPVIDVSGLPVAERERETERLVVEDARRPFDLERGPLLRTTMIRLGPDDHLFMLRMHHICADGWSMGIWAREISAYYIEHAGGQKAGLSPLPIQYGDFAVWQRQWLQGAVVEQQLAYWTEQLDGIANLELPTDRPRPPVQTYRGAFHAIELSESLTRNLKTLAQREDCTLFMLLLSAFDVLLQRWSGQDDIVVGTYIANRNRTEIENLIGFFLNTLVFRATFSEEVVTFSDLLRQTRERALGAFAHQDLPFEFLVEHLKPERDLSRNPIFQVTFQLNNAPTQQTADNAVENLDFKRGTAIFDLCVMLFETSSGLVGHFEYSTDLFDAETIRRMGSQYVQLLENVVAAPESRLSALPLLPAAERTQVCRTWNDTYQPHDLRSGILDLLARHVEVAPTSTAFVCGASGRTLSFDDLWRSSNRLAHHLQRLGVAAGDIVALHLPRSLDAIVALLAVVKCGAAWLPLDPSYPKARLVGMLEHSAARVAIGTGSNLASLGLDAEITVDLEREAEAIALADDTDPGLRPGLAAAAYVLYTSGSTGTPKGIVANHRQILNRLHWMWRVYPFGPDEVAAQKTALSFVDSIWEVFGALLQRRPTVVVPDEIVRDPMSLVAMLAEHGVSRLWLVPALLRTLLNDMPDLGARVPTLGFFVSSGEPLATDVVELFREACPRARLYNLYGTSECWDATWYDASCRDGTAGRVPIGHPIDNVLAYVLDADRQPAPIGVVGELFIGGMGLAEGYLHEPERTERRFVEVSVDDGPRTRLFCTGDRARWRGDGELEFIGRADHQAKVRGFRVEPAEVECHLAAHPEVREAAVLATEDVDGEARLDGWFVPLEQANPTQAELRRHLLEFLPEFMVPSSLTRVEALPLTGSGKLDRRALQTMGAVRPELEVDYVEPRDALENVLAAVFAEVLGVDRVGVRDGFFSELGGHSLKATQLVSRLRDLIGMELPIRWIFEFPTVELLAQHLAAGRGAEPSAQETAEQLLRLERMTDAEVELELRDGPDEEQVPRRKKTARRFDLDVRRKALLRQWQAGRVTPAEPPSTGPSPTAPLSFVQQRMWFLERLTPGTTFHVIETTTRVPWRLHVPALRKVVRRIADRHQILRTNFLDDDGQPRQVVHDELDVDIPVRDLTEVPIETRNEELERFLAEIASEPFDLSSGPLLRVAVVRFAEREDVLHLRFHHIVCDGWSLGIFSDELRELYAAELEGRAHTLPPLPLQYSDFAARQCALLRGEHVETLLSYWRNKLDGLVPTELPGDHRRPAVQSHRGRHAWVELEREVVTGLAALARREGCTLFMVMLAAFERVLVAHSGSTDIAVGTAASNRDGTDTERLIGCFLNTLVLRTEHAGCSTFRDVLQRVRTTCLEAFANQDLPFEMLVEELQPPRDLSRNPLFQISFQLNNAPGQQAVGNEEEVLAARRGAALFDLLVMVIQSDDALSIQVEYATDLFEPSSIAGLMEDYRALLRAASRDPDISCDRLLQPSEPEFTELRELLRGPECDLSSSLPLASRMTRALTRGGNEAAVLAGGEVLSFAELDRRTRVVARALMDRGVAAGSRIGLVLDRSIDAVCCILAALRVGASWMPVSPAAPPRRVETILAEARPVLLVSAGPRPDAAGIDRLDIETLDWDEEPSECPVHAAGLDDEFCVLHTSGSTGRPKGVSIPHGAVVNRLEWMWSEHPFQSADVGAHKTSLGFIDAIWEILGPLLAGVPIAIIEENAVRDPERLVRELAGARVTQLWLVPSLLRAMVAVTPELGKRLPSLRLVVVSGEQLTGETVRGFHEACPQARLLNAYGTTEVWDATFGLVTPSEGAAAWVTAGRPIRNVELFVLDDDRRPVRRGVPGCLWVAGDGLSGGYVGDAHDGFQLLTLPDGDVVRAYCTGDLARVRPGGELEIQGRIDSQLSVRGVRIEPSEVESALHMHPDVQEAAVATDALGDGETLGAWIVPGTAQTTLSASDLRSFLRSRLPDAMIPARFNIIDVLPRTESGKVDRGSLVRVARTAPLRVAFEPPCTETERKVAHLFSALLRVDRIGRNDDFFQLGGHSLLATQACARVRADWGVDLSVAAFFETPTVVAVARHVDRRGGEALSAGPRLKRLSRERYRRPIGDSTDRSSDGSRGSDA